ESSSRTSPTPRCSSAEATVAPVGPLPTIATCASRESGTCSAPEDRAQNKGAAARASIDETSTLRAVARSAPREHVAAPSSPPPLADAGHQRPGPGPRALGPRAAAPRRGAPAGGCPAPEPPRRIRGGHL